MAQGELKLRNTTLTWIGILIVLFPILALAGVALRLVQTKLPGGSGFFFEGSFYQLMTLHGVGMVGVIFVGGMAAVTYLLSRHVRPSPMVGQLVLALTFVGVVLLVAATMAGRFAPGWYFLYPLPLKSEGGWAPWAFEVYLWTLWILLVAWIVWVVDLLRAIAQRYSLSRALGWHYLRGQTEPEVPPLVLITTVSMVVSLAALIAGVVVTGLYTWEVLTKTPNDPLLMKNLTFLFGHVLVNANMYLAVAVVYELLPAYTERPWKNNKLVALAWNSVLVMVLFAYFHHLYMDFAQPKWVQVVGQISSYLSSVPAAVMSIFGTLALVHHSKMKWNLASLAFFVGIMNWAIGGVAAVIDATISVNSRFHNTLWVPAHFHTYYFLGAGLIIFGFAYHFCQELANVPEQRGTTTSIFALLFTGGVGFVSMFYLGGAYSVPRRFAFYPAELKHGAIYSRVSLLFIGLMMAGLALFFWEVFLRWRKVVIGPVEVLEEGGRDWLRLSLWATSATVASVALWAIFF